MIIRTLICLLGFTFSIFPVICNAQGSCVIGTKKVSNLRGRVVTEKYCVTQAKIELQSWKNKKTIETVVTDDDGNFHLQHIKKGKYFIFVSRDMFSSLLIPVNFEPKQRNDEKILLVHLAPAYKDACSEGGVELTLDKD